MDTKAHRVDITPSFPAQTLRHISCFLEMLKHFFFNFLLSETCQSGSPGSSLVHTKLPQVFQSFFVSDLSKISISFSLHNSACDYLLAQYTWNLTRSHYVHHVRCFPLMLSQAFFLHLATYFQGKHRNPVSWTLENLVKSIRTVEESIYEAVGIRIPLTPSQNVCVHVPTVM